MVTDSFPATNARRECTCSTPETQTLSWQSLTHSYSHSVLAPLVLPCRSFTTAGFITTFIIVVVAVVSALFCAFKFQTGRNPQSIQDVIDLVYVAASFAHAPSSCGLTSL